MVLLNAAHLPPGSVIGSPVSSSAGWRKSGFPRPTQRGTRRKISGLRALWRGVPLVQACSRRAQTLRGGMGRLPICDGPPTPFRVVKFPTLVGARALYLLVVFTMVNGFLPLRGR